LVRSGFFTAQCVFRLAAIATKECSGRDGGAAPSAKREAADCCIADAAARRPYQSD
jgi:hypothetical protein